MVYITGDTHGELGRFKQGELSHAGKNDTVIVLGDFGFLWDGSAEEQRALDWLRKRPYTLLFLDGAHENFDMLAQYPEQQAFGGRVQALGGNVYHICRGSIIELEGQSYLCFGSAETSEAEKEERTPGVNWWPQEAPTDADCAFCEENLARRSYKVDYVLTHDAPSKFLSFAQLAMGETNRLHSFLDEIVMKTEYKQWYFGCYHNDIRLSPKSRGVFCEVISIGEKRSVWPFKRR